MNPYWSFLIPSAPNEPRMRWPGVSHSAQVALRSQGPARPAPWPKAFLLILFILIPNGTTGCFLVMGVSPIAGWFISGKIPSINGWWLGRGYPHSWKPLYIYTHTHTYDGIMQDHFYNKDKYRMIHKSRVREFTQILYSRHCNKNDA